MTSINSSNNIFKMFRVNFRRYAVIFGIFGAAAIILSVILISSIDFMYGADGEAMAPLDITRVFAEEIKYFALFCCIQAFIFVTIMFHEIYSKRACDFFFSKPVKRGTWFNSNYFFGVISIAVSYVVMAVAFVLAFKCHIVKKFLFLTIDQGDMFQYIGMSFLAVLVLYTVFVMCACVSGRMWQYIFLSFISTGVLCLGAVGAISYLNTIYGAWFNLSNNFFVSALGLVFNNLSNRQVNQFLIAAIVQLVIFYIAGFLVFKRRKSEIAENCLAGKVLPVVLTAVCFLSEVFLCMGISEEISLTGRIIAAIVMVAITAIVLSAIFFRKAISKTILISLAGTVAISAVFIFCVQVITEKNYVNYIPASSEVESVSVTNYGGIGSPSMTDLLYGVNYLNVDNSYHEDFSFSTDEGKEKVLDFHKKILSKETRNNIYSSQFYSEGNNTVKLDYKLKNGKEISRIYTVSTFDIMNEYASVLKTEEGIDQMEVFSIKEDDFLFAVLYRYNIDTEDYENGVYIQDADGAKLFECVKCFTSRCGKIFHLSQY